MNPYARRTQLPRALGGVLVLAGACHAAFAAQPPHAAASTSTAAPRSSPYRSMATTEGAKDFYATAWGIGELHVKLTNSDNLVRFSFRVLDPARAKPLGTAALKPEMVALRSNAVLSVPTMENVGPLRQIALTDVNKEYWVVFSNRGRPVRSGDRVNVIIGSFRGQDLLVE